MIATSRNLESILSRKAAEHLRAFQAEIHTRFPGKISRLILFGSRARGDARRDSDYDVAVFVRDLENRWAINHVFAEIAYPHIWKGSIFGPLPFRLIFST
jgi:uncharacterized protein